MHRRHPSVPAPAAAAASPAALPSPEFCLVGPFWRQTGVCRAAIFGRRLEAIGKLVRVGVTPDGVTLAMLPRPPGPGRPRIPVLLEGVDGVASSAKDAPPPAPVDVRLSWDDAARIARAMGAWMPRRDGWTDLYAKRTRSGRIVLLKIRAPGPDAPERRIVLHDERRPDSLATLLAHVHTTSVRACAPVEIAPGLLSVATLEIPVAPAPAPLPITVGELWGITPTIELRVLRGEAELRVGDKRIAVAPEDAPLFETAVGLREVAAIPPPRPPAPPPPAAVGVEERFKEKEFSCGDDDSFDTFDEENNSRLREEAAARGAPPPPPSQPQPSAPADPALRPTPPHPGVDAAMRRFQTLLASLTGADGRKLDGLSGRGVFLCPAPRYACGDGCSGCRVCGDAHILVLELATDGPHAGLPVFRKPKDRAEIEGLRLERARQDWATYGTEWGRACRR